MAANRITIGIKIMQQQELVIPDDVLFLIWEFLPTDQQLKLLLLDRAHKQVISNWLNAAIPDEVKQDFFANQLQQAVRFNNQFNKLQGATVLEKINNAFDMHDYLPFLTPGERPQKFVEKLFQTSAPGSYMLSTMDQLEQPYHLAMRFAEHKIKINQGEINQPQQLVADNSWLNTYVNYYQKSAEGKRIYDNLAGFVATRQGLADFITAFQQQIQNGRALFMPIKQVGKLLAGLKRFNYITNYSEYGLSPDYKMLMTVAVFLCWCLSQPQVIQNYSQLLTEWVHQLCGYSDQPHELRTDSLEQCIFFTRMVLLNLLVKARAMTGDRQVINAFYHVTEECQNSEKSLVAEVALAKKIDANHRQLSRILGGFKINQLGTNANLQEELDTEVKLYAHGNFSFWRQAREVRYKPEQTAKVEPQINFEDGEKLVTAYVGLRCS